LTINLLSVAVILASLVDILPEPLDTRDFRNTAEALSSFLRIPTAGFRGHIYGALGNVGADANKTQPAVAMLTVQACYTA
jgi:hypothetical protein